MRTISLVTVAGCLLQAGAASAHIQLIDPPDRFTNNSLSPGPCGSGTRTGKPPTKLVPGQTLVVSWKEVVSHAGHYRIALSAKESDFTDPTNLSIPNPSPSWVLLDGIQDKTGNQTYSQSVEIPNKECPACVLQVIQVASGGSDGTNTGSLFTVYHACADVSMTGAAVDAGLSQDAFGAHDAAVTSDALTAVDGHAGAGGGAGQDGFGGSPASSGGISGTADAVGGTGGLSPGGTGSGGSPQSTGGQGDSGRVSAGGATGGNSHSSVDGSGGRSSLATGQGDGGHASLSATSSSGGALGTGGGPSSAAVAASATGGSRDQGNKPAASGGCQIAQGRGSSPWFMLAIAFVLPAFLRKKGR